MELLFLFFGLALSPLLSSAHSETETLAKKQVMVDQILSSMEKVATFMDERDYGIFVGKVRGFPIIPEQLDSVHEAWLKDSLLKPLSKRVGRMSTRLARFNYKSYVYYSKHKTSNMTVYLKTVLPWFWKPPQAWTYTNASMVYSFKNTDSLPKNATQECILQLLHTRDHRFLGCAYSHVCENYVTVEGLSASRLSEQLFYFLISRMMGCTDGLFNKTQHYMDLFCSNLMDLNKFIESEKYTPNLRDIFMENIMLCGMAGYVDFYKNYWLDVILSWELTESPCLVGQNYCTARHPALALGVLSGFLYALENVPQLYDPKLNAAS